MSDPRHSLSIAKVDIRDRSYLAGCLVLLCTSLPVALDHGAGVPGLAVSMVLVAVGVGGVKATFSPFLGKRFAQQCQVFMLILITRGPVCPEGG